MLIRSGHPIRCLEHNSVVSIFCESENRLLCTNCVFGKNDHRFHKIHPIDKSYEKVRLEIDKMKPAIAKEITVIDNIKEVVLNNLDAEVAELHRSLEQLTIRYAEAHQLLEESFFKAKNKLLNGIEQVKIRHETVALELNFLRELYDVKPPLLNLDL